MHGPREGGQVGGRYELVRRLARGGGGTVWAGHDRLLQRDVAIKHVRVSHDLGADSERARARVRSEARAAARLVHPGVVAIFDVVDDHEDVFLVLEHVTWPTLSARVEAEGPLPERDVARIGLGVLDALEAAHARGIVHRDVKPSNVFASPDGEVKLSDFGIAAIEGEARLTNTGATMGSPSFLAPEQAQGHRAAPPADLWSLGVTLAHAVEGVPPFERSSAIATVHAVVHDPPRPFARAEALAGPLLDLLVKDPSRRPDPAAVRAALLPIAGPDAPASRPASSPPVVAVRSSAPSTDASAATATPRATDAPAGADAPADAARPDDDAAATVSGGAGRRAPLALVGCALVVALGVGVATLGGDDRDGTVAAPEAAAPADDDADPPSGADDGSEADGDAPPDTEEDDTGAEEADDEAIPLASPPGDWQRIEGDTYTVAVPADWEVAPGSGNLVDHRDPDTGAYLRVDWTDQPEDDPVANWERFESTFASGRDGYQQLALRPATFQGSPAAYWEYRYEAGGQEVRAINLNVRVDDGRAYALNLQAPADAWDEVAADFPALAGGFEDDRPA